MEERKKNNAIKSSRNLTNLKGNRFAFSTEFRCSEANKLSFQIISNVALELIYIRNFWQTRNATTFVILLPWDSNSTQDIR